MTRCPWYIAGPLLGLLIVGLRAAVNRPLGALGGYIELTERVATPSRWGLPVFVLFGIIVGGFVFSASTGTFALGVGYGGWFPGLSMPAQAALLVGAGATMGFGARMAGGCTSGHGLCGISLGSPASVVATMTFFATAVAVAHVLASAGGGF